MFVLCFVMVFEENVLREEPLRVAVKRGHSEAGCSAAHSDPTGCSGGANGTRSVSSVRQGQGQSIMTGCGLLLTRESMALCHLPGLSECGGLQFFQKGAAKPSVARSPSN